MRVRYTRTALRELEEILSCIAEQNPPAAAARIERVVAWIADFPHMGPLLDETVRLMPVGRYPFFVFYTADQDGVTVRNIRHVARRRPDAID